MTTGRDRFNKVLYLLIKDLIRDLRRVYGLETHSFRALGKVCLEEITSSLGSWDLNTGFFMASQVFRSPGWESGAPLKEPSGTQVISELLWGMDVLLTFWG